MTTRAAATGLNAIWHHEGLIRVESLVSALTSIAMTSSDPVLDSMVALGDSAVRWLEQAREEEAG
jgi:hypothetical protein